MGLFDARNNAADLLALLDRERKAILAGDFDALRRILSDKQRLVALAARDRPEGDILQRLRQKAARNQAMLEAAAQGIRSVAGRLGDLPVQDLETYDRQGQRWRSSGELGSMERRF